MNENRERRVKTILIPQRAFLAWLNAFRNHNFIEVPEFEGVPEGAEIEHVWYSYDPLGLHASVYHPSFDIVPAGEIAPRLDSGGTLRTARRIIEVAGPEPKTQIVTEGTGADGWLKTVVFAGEDCDARAAAYRVDKQIAKAFEQASSGIFAFPIDEAARMSNIDQATADRLVFGLARTKSVSAPAFSPGFLYKAEMVPESNYPQARIADAEADRIEAERRYDEAKARGNVL